LAAAQRLPGLSYVQGKPIHALSNAVGLSMSIILADLARKFNDGFVFADKQ